MFILSSDKDQRKNLLSLSLFGWCKLTFRAAPLFYDHVVRDNFMRDYIPRQLSRRVPNLMYK